MSSAPPQVAGSRGGQPGAPLANRGFLADLDLLYRQVTAGGERARSARQSRANSQYPTGDPDAALGEAAVGVVEDHLNLTRAAFVRLVELLRVAFAEDESLEDAEWWDVVSILVDARKRSLDDAWIQEERSEGLHFDRKTFWRPKREPGQGEWSARLDRHADGEPFVDPEWLTAADLAERPHGDAAQDLYDDRKATLEAKHSEFRRTVEHERRSLEGVFETARSDHDAEVQRLASQRPASGEVPPSLASQSPLDPVLDTHYGSISWPAVSGDWEDRFEWLADGLDLTDESNLSGSEQQHLQDARAKLDDLSLWLAGFDRLRTLRQQAKPWVGRSDEGLDNDQLSAVGRLLPTGNPLDPVLTAVYNPRSGNQALQSVFGSGADRWAELFADVRQSVDEQGSSQPAALDAMKLSADKFDTVLSLRRAATRFGEDASLESALLDDVVSTLTTIWKRLHRYDESRSGNWIDAERSAGVTDYWDARKHRLPKWRAASADRAAWQRALGQRSASSVVDPDLIQHVDAFAEPAWNQDAYDLWQDRTDFLIGDGDAIVPEVALLRDEAAADNRRSASDRWSLFSANCTRVIGVPLSDLKAISDAMADGQDVGARLTRLDLDAPRLSYLLEVATRLDQRPITEKEWANVANVLRSVWKRRQYGRWRREERAHDVVLEPDQFDLPDEESRPEPPAEDDPVRWRVTWSIRDEWTDLLKSRIDALDGVDERIAAAVAAAERKAIPLYREALLERIDAAPDVPRRAEWCSERFLIDTEMYGGAETTRVSQAITSLQTLFQSIDADLGVDRGGLSGLEPALTDEHFDERWQWLGTYPKWRAAMGVYLYPENVLLPSLRDRTTDRFDDIAGRLARRQSLDIEVVNEQVESYREYMEDLIWLTPRAGTMVASEDTPDSEVPLAYAVGYSGTNPDNYYYTAFVPDDDTAPTHRDSTWSRIPTAKTEAIDRIVGADTYNGEVYLFTTTEGEGGSGGSDDDGSDDSGGGFDNGLQYLRYDVREGTWTGPTGIDLPDEVGGGSLELYMESQDPKTPAQDVPADDVEVKGVFQIQQVMQPASVDSPPTILLVLRLRAPGQKTKAGVPIEELFYYPLQFGAHGGPPELDSFPSGDLVEFAGGYIVTDEMREEFGGGSWFDGFVLTANRGGNTDIDVFTTGWIDRLFVADYADNNLINDPDIEEVAAQEIDGMEHEHPHDTYRDVIHRPTKNELIVLPNDEDGKILSIPWSGRYGDYRRYDWGQIEPESDVTCNNAMDLSNRGEASNEVLLGTGDVGNKYTDPPVQIALSTVDGSVSTEIEMALAPPFDRSQGEQWGDSVDPWLFGPRPDDLLAESKSYEGRFERTTQNHRSVAKNLLDRTNGLTRVYVEECYYLLPVFVGRQLNRSDRFQDALKWFRTVYDYAMSGDDRAIWPPLEATQAGQWAGPNPTYGWLRDPIKPHAIAETRSNPYLKFTLYSIVQTLLDYADDEYATDTAETVANATQLYEEALDFLEADVLERTGDPCGDLLDQLDGLIDEYVINAKIWTDDETLTREGVEQRVEAIEADVRSIPDYTDRQEAVSSIRYFLREDEFLKAVSEASEWAERESNPYRPREDGSQYGPLLGVESLAERLTDAASVVERLATPHLDVIGGQFGGGSGLGGGSSGRRWIEAGRLGAAETNIDAVGLAERADLTSDGRIIDLQSGSRFGPSSGGASGDWTTVSGDGSDVTTDGGIATVDPRVASASMDVLGPTDNEFCVPRNGYERSLRRRATVNLRKIREGRNIAGMKRQLDPYSAPTSVESATPTSGSIGGTTAGLGGGAMPTNYRYETLLDRAQELADRAAQFEAEFLRAIEKGEREELSLKKAKQQVELAEERVSLQELRLKRAQDKVELARLRREKARLRRDTYADWIETGKLADMKMAQALLTQSASLQTKATVLHLAAAALSFGAAGTSVIPGAALSNAASGVSSTAAAASARAGALSSRSQVLQMEASFRRRERRWELQKQLAQKDVEVGNQRITIAQDTINIVRQEQEIAELRVDQAKQIVNFHQNEFTNEALYDWMAQVLKGVYRYFLQQATATARMAQRQLAFERQGLPRRFIKNDYWETGGQAGTQRPAIGSDEEEGGTDRRGMTGSARLLRDIYELDQHEFETEQRRLEVEETISVARLDPLALQQFRETGVLSIATDLEEFQQRHPGQYHRLIESVEVDLIALTDPVEGINATLSNSGTSRIVTGGTMFREQTIDRDPEQVVLNRADSEREGLSLRPRERELLRPFENSGVATDWELRMPPAANDMDYSSIADIQLTISYTALESYDYREQVIAKLDDERVVERSFSFHDHFGDAWYELGDAPGGERTVRFETDREDFPATLSELAIDELQLYVVGPTGDDRERLKDMELSLRNGAGSTVTGRATDGTLVASSAFSGDSPDQDWELTARPTGGADPFTDGTVEDLLLVISIEGRAPGWPR
jgi:hypothetical protein